MVLRCLYSKDHSTKIGGASLCGGDLVNGSGEIGVLRNRKFKICEGVEAQRFDLRFLRPFRADLSIRKSSSFFPPLIAATSQRGLPPRPAQVSPDGPRYLGGTFLPFNVLTGTLPRGPVRKAIALSILSICFCSSARCSRSISSTRFRRSMSASTLIRDRFTLGMVISGAKTLCSLRWSQIDL